MNYKNLMRDKKNDFIRANFKGYISDTDGDCEVAMKTYGSNPEIYNAGYTFPITKEMLDILSSMKGKTLKSIEGEYLSGYKKFCEFVRFNLGQFAIEIYSYEKEVQWFWNADQLIDDEATCFTVYKKDLNGHLYSKGWEPIKLLKDEKISEVIVVRDLIKNNKTVNFLFFY